MKKYFYLLAIWAVNFVACSDESANKGDSVIVNSSMEVEMYSFISQLFRVKDIRHLLKVSRLHSTLRKILRVVQEQELLTL